eukprot:11834774-Heterocapsa_arctica.AAC.1
MCANAGSISAVWRSAPTVHISGKDMINCKRLWVGGERQLWPLPGATAGSQLDPKLHSGRFKLG